MTLTEVADESRCCCSCRHNARTWDGEGNCITTCRKDGHYIGYIANFGQVCEEWEGNNADNYIRKQDAVDTVPKERIVEYMDEFGAGFNSCRNDILRSIESLTSADVAPVVHGKWMKEDKGRVEYCAVCDQCGFDWMWSDRGYFKFCPNCGARMDAKERG